MITRKDVEGNTWRQDAEGGWHPWDDIAAPAAPAAQAAQAAPAPAPEGMSFGDQALGFAGSIGQGASANFLDEVLAAPMAGAAHLLGDAPEGESVFDTYSKMKNSIRGRQKAYEADSPNMAMTGKLVGGMAGLGKLGVGKTAAQTAAKGAGYGAAEYAGSLDEWSDAELTDAIVQTGLSGAMGGALHKGGDVARTWLAERPDAVSKVLNKLKTATGSTDDQLRAGASSMGPEASLADITGDVGVAFSQGARSRGGLPAIDAIEENLKKTEGAKDRIRDTMSQVSGKKEGQYFESLDALKSNRKARADTKYGEALDGQYLKPDPEIERLLNDVPIVKNAWDKVIGKEMQKGNRNLPPKGDRSVMPSMRAMQKVKWELDAMISRRAKSTDSAGKDEMADLIEARKMLMSRVNRQSPAFKDANKAYAGDSAMLDAQEMGVKHGLGGANVEAQLEHIKKLTGAEKDAYLQGVMSNAYGKLGASPEHMMGNINQMSSGNSRKVLDKLVGKDKAGKLMNQFKTERRYREVDTKVRQGSQTQLRDVADDAMGRMGRKVPFDEFADLPLARVATSTIMKFIPRMDVDAAAEVADILTKGGGVDAAIKRMVEGGANMEVAEGVVMRLLRQGGTVAPTLGED